MQPFHTSEIQNFFTESEKEKAFQVAKQRQLPILVDFWATGCKGCKKMEMTTYQNERVVSYIEKHFVFVKYDITNRNVPKLISSPILWTPTFIFFDSHGGEVRKTIGYLNNIQFEAEMELARASACLRAGKPDLADKILGNFIQNTAYKILLPEGLYWAGVASYFLNKKDAASLVPFWEKLLNYYPETVWAQRADCLDIAL